MEKNRRSLKFGAEPELIAQPPVSDKLRVMGKSLKITFPTYYQFSLIIFEEQVGDVVALGEDSEPWDGINFAALKQIIVEK